MADSDRRAETRLEQLLDRYLYLDRQFQARGGVGALIATWERLQSDLAHVAEGELEGLRQEIAELVATWADTEGVGGPRVVEALQKMDHELHRLRALKRVLTASEEARETAGGCRAMVLR